MSNINELISYEFLILQKELIYLNHAAVAPWPRRTVEAVEAFSSENCYFGAQNYPAWLKTEMKLRKQLQAL